MHYIDILVFSTNFFKDLILSSENLIKTHYL